MVEIDNGKSFIKLNGDDNTETEGSTEISAKKVSNVVSGSRTAVMDQVKFLITSEDYLGLVCS